MRSVVVALAVVATGCFPTLPPHLAEGTRVLPAGGVSLNVAGGAGSFEGKDANGAWANQFAAGFEARLRTGLGAKQEIGVSVFGGAGTSLGNGDPPFDLGGKLSYKIAPIPWLAIVVDGGAMDHAVSAIAVFGADLAVVLAPYTSPSGTQLYVGLKGGFAVPVLQNATNVNESIEIPIGLEIPTSKKVRFYIEAGPLAGFAQQSSPGGSSSTNSLGGYGVVAFTFLLR